MRKRLAMLLVCAGMLPLLAVPTAAAKSVYFTAVNENILELKEETMPFWSGQNLYVDSAIFSDRWLGLYCNRNRVNGTVVILETSGQRRALVFELDTGYALREADSGCGFSCRFQSVIGTGVIRPVTDPEEKRHGLEQIMGHLSGRTDWDFPEGAVQSTAVFRLDVTDMTCKEHP